MSDEMKKCPFCDKEIKADAVKCRFCGKFLNENAQEEAEKKKAEPKKSGKKGKSILNKFLNLSFAIGKVFSSILLFIVLFLVLIAAGIFVFKSSSSVKTPKFVAPVVEATVDESDTSASSSSSSSSSSASSAETVSPTDKMIDEVVAKCSLADNAANYMKGSVSDTIPDKYTNQYITGFAPYCKAAIKFYTQDKNTEARNQLIVAMVDEVEYYPTESDYDYAKANYKDEDGKYSVYFSVALVDNYTNEFTSNVKASEASKEESLIIRLSSLGVVVVGLFIFVILLFLPVLIKIEENTRFAIPKSEENK